MNLLRMIEGKQEKIYQDTENGAEKMVKSFFSNDKFDSRDLADAVFSRDRYVKGVWKIDWNDGTRWIAHLAGYPDVYNRVRDKNEVEEGRDPDFKKD